MTMNWVLNQIDGMGRFVTKNIEYSVNIFLLAYVSTRAAFLDKAQGLRQIFSVISAQIYFTGWQALPLITVLSLATGSILMLQALSNLTLVGGVEVLGSFMIAILVREVAPLLTAIVVIARSGTAVASEVGTMRVNHEIEALESIGINPLSYIVFPRVVGGLISVLCLSFYFNVIGLFGGYFLTKFFHEIPLGFFVDSLATAFSKEDIWVFLLKNSFSGVVIFIVCCYQGLLVRKSPHEVPQVTTQAVVTSVIYVTVFNMGVTALFYLSQLKKIGLV